jgi:predicted MFS family arabinose efflux permease
MILLSAWLVTLLVAVSEAPSWGWGSARVVGLIVASAVLIAMWVWSEQRARNPLIDINMMRRPAVWTNNLVALLVGVGIYSVYTFVPEYVQTPSKAGYGFGVSVTGAGLILLPTTVGTFVTGMYAGRLARGGRGKWAVAVGCFVTAMAMAMLAFASGEEWELYLATAIVGAGFGLAFSAMSGLIVAAVPPEQTGVVSGMNANIRTIGGAIGAAVMASIVTSKFGVGGFPEEVSYKLGFAVLAVALAGAALAAAFIPPGPEQLAVDRGAEAAPTQN